jgi:Spy/CpxP family protein refolding chaperone
MKTRLSWKLIAALILVFVAGGVAGSALTAHLIGQAFRKSLQFENWATNTEESLARKLNLTPEQRPKAHAIIQETEKEFAAIFSRTLRECGEVIVRSGRRLDVFLSAEQRAVHARMKEDLRKSLRKDLQMELPPDDGPAVIP